MKKLLLITSLLTAMLSVAQAPQHYSRAKIITGNKGLQELGELGIAVDHGTVKQNTHFISDFSSQEIEKVRAAGYEVEILIEDVQQYYIDRNANPQGTLKNINCSEEQTGTFTPEIPDNFNLGSMGGFYTYQEFLDEIDAMAAQYPNLITAKAPISTFQSIEGRPIYFLKISDNVSTDETEPEILYTAIHHAREPNSLSNVIFYMWYLLENYATSEEIQFLVNNSELYFVPMINPDGYLYNQTTSPNGGGMWRKNRRNNGDGSFGVDLNRNYLRDWGTTGISFDTSNDTYPGTGPFSEPETQAIRWFCENRDFIFAFNAHTYSDLILYPYGADELEFAPDHDYFHAFTEHMVMYNQYENKKSSDLYEASGDSDDYMYDSDLTQKPKIFAMTPEIGGPEMGFWPQEDDITGLCQEMVFPNLILAHLAHKYLEVKDTDPSVIETMTGNFNHSAVRMGQESGPVTVSLTPLEGIQSTGTEIVYDLALMATTTGAIAYALDPGIQFGETIRYVLHTEYDSWTRHDTIVKTFGAITTQLLEDASSAVNWTGNWGTTGTTFVSPSFSFTDSPVGNYQNSDYQEYRFNQTIDLTNATSAGVKFYARWDIENDYDFCQFQVSLDGGFSWQGQCGVYTNPGSSVGGAQPAGEPVYDGQQLSWVLEEISLDDYLGEEISVQFILGSDEGVKGDGFYFDDFEVMYEIDDSGMAENEPELSVKTMPNPANASVQVVFGEPVSKGTIEVYGMTGELVCSQTISGLSNKTELDTRQWAEGMYTVVVSGTGRASNPAKLVVIH